MDLVVVRHALAWERDPKRWPDDSKRPLRPLGVRRFRAASRGLARMMPRVDAVWTSPAARAAQTAAILHEEAGWPQPKAVAALVEDASALAILRAAARARGLERLVVVGHAPNLDDLVTLALCGKRARAVVRLSKGGVACLRFETAPRPGGARLEWGATQGLLRALGD